jgi:26S proteasome regulatory subunit N1
MTSVPKPLKFLRPFYSELESVRESWDESKLGDEKVSASQVTPSGIIATQWTPPQSLLSSILSVLAMTYSDNGNRDTLHYRIISNSKDSPGLWGHEYCRHLASEIGEEYALLIADMGSGAQTTDGEAAVNGETLTATDNSSIKALHTTSPTDADNAQTPRKRRPLKSRDQLFALALELVPFFLSHNAEADAVDLLLELESIESIEQFMDAKPEDDAEKTVAAQREAEDRYRRVCVYMVR